MRRYPFLLFGFFFVVTIAKAQQNKKSLLCELVTKKHQSIKEFYKADMFKENKHSQIDKEKAFLSKKIALLLDKQATAKIFSNKPGAISLSLPSGQGIQQLLELVQQDINTGFDFGFGTIDVKGNQHRNSRDQGLHYRGYVKGDSSSFASFSIFANGEVMGIFCNNEGNFNVAKLSGTDTGYVLYNSKDLQMPMHFECSTSENAVISLNKNSPQYALPSIAGVALPTCKKINLYWEAGYKLFSNNFNSDITATQNYLTGIFNEVSTMYQNEGILVELSNCYVWTCVEPYAETTAYSALDAFKTRWDLLSDGFKGDFAMLIDGAPTNNGGIAYLLENDLCNRNYAFGYCNVYGAYNAVPVYSWDVHVLTHETGHLLGAHHTHWCGWNTGPSGTCGAIDNCATIEPANNCSTCTVTSNINNNPAGFTGTVMSYCHLINNVGINLANGFGPLPGAVIRSNVSLSVCTERVTKWTGSVNKDWENSGNWNCGMLPDATTEVIIEGGLKNYPVVKKIAICKSIKQLPGASLKVNSHAALNIMGLPSN